MFDLESAKIGIIGLGYVGLPLAIEFGKRYPTVGLDIKAERIEELKAGEDSTREVTGEELALISTIYANSYLGLSVLYSYLEYNPINPHRIAAMNYVRSVAGKTGKAEMVDDPSLLRNLPVPKIKRFAKEHFNGKEEKNG